MVINAKQSFNMRNGIRYAISKNTKHCHYSTKEYFELPVHLLIVPSDASSATLLATFYTTIVGLPQSIINKRWLDDFKY